MSLINQDIHRVEMLYDEIALLKEENRQLRELLLPETPPQFEMTNGEWRLACITLRHTPITKERLYELFYWEQDNPPDPKGLDVLMYRARKKLAPHGIYIQTVNRWGYQAVWDDSWPANPLVTFELWHHGADKRTSSGLHA